MKFYNEEKILRYSLLLAVLPQNLLDLISLLEKNDENDCDCLKNPNRQIYLESHNISPEVEI